MIDKNTLEQRGAIASVVLLCGASSWSLVPLLHVSNGGLCVVAILNGSIFWYAVWYLKFKWNSAVGDVWGSEEWDGAILVLGMGIGILYVVMLRFIFFKQFNMLSSLSGGDGGFSVKPSEFFCTIFAQFFFICIDILWLGEIFSQRKKRKK